MGTVITFLNKTICSIQPSLAASSSHQFLFLWSTLHQTKQDLKRTDDRSVSLLITEFCTPVALLLLEYAPTGIYSFTQLFLIVGTDKRLLLLQQL